MIAACLQMCSSLLHMTQLMSTFHLCQVETSRMLDEIKELHDKIRQSAEEAKKKEALYKQLVRILFFILKTFYIKLNS